MTMRTFTEWLDGYIQTVIVDPDHWTREDIKAAWQACAAEYQPQLDALEAKLQVIEIAATGKQPLTGEDDPRWSVAYLDVVSAVYQYRAIIDEARKLEAKWSEDMRGASAVRLIELGLSHSEELRAVLDRSGARCGSVAASPASSPDNPPTNTDRSAT